MKYRVTNTTASTDTGARNVFLIEAGKLLAPGESVPCNRLDAGTRKLGETGVIKIEEGDFPKPSPLPVKEEAKAEAAKIEPLPPKKAKKAKPPKPAPEPAPAPTPAPEPAPAPEPKPEPKPAADDKQSDEQSGKTSSEN